MAAELGRTAAAKHLTPAQVAERQRQAQDGTWLRVCEARQLKPAALAACPPDALARYIADVTGRRPSDPARLPALAKSFAERHAANHRNPPPR